MSALFMNITPTYLTESKEIKVLGFNLNSNAANQFDISRVSMAM